MVRDDGFRVEIHYWQEEIPLADGECFILTLFIVSDGRVRFYADLLLS